MTDLVDSGVSSYANLADLLRKHPEVEEACLICVTNSIH